MSRAADMAAARARASQSIPGLGAASQIPTDDQAIAEARMLDEFGANTVRAQAGDFDDVPVSAPVAAPVQEEKQAPKDLLSALSEIPGGPTKKELQEMKATYPEVLVLAIRDNEVYIYRYLTHFEWRKQLLTQKNLIEDQEALKDAVLQRCVLWPRMSPVEINTKQAGLRDLLYEVILKSSYFLDPDAMISQVMRL